MADPTAICAALASQIAKNTGGILTPHGFAPGQVVPPAVVCIPGVPAVTYGITMDGEVNINLRAIVLLGAAADDYGQLDLNSYVASSGSHSVLQAVAVDHSLAGTCEFAEVINVSTYGFVEYAGQQYFGATFTLQVGAHL